MARIPYEQETVIIFNEAEPYATVWSPSPKTHRKMEKLGYPPIKISPGRRGKEKSEESRGYRMPKKCVQFKPERKVSEKERERLAAQGFGRRKPTLNKEGRPEEIHNELISNEQMEKQQSDAICPDRKIRKKREK